MRKPRAAINELNPPAPPTGDLPSGAVKLCHAVDLAEQNTLTRLQAMSPVIHACHHPRIILHGIMGESDYYPISETRLYTSADS